MLENSSFGSKLLFFIFGGIICLACLILGMYLFSIYGAGLLLLYMPIFIFFSAFLGLIAYGLKYKDYFERFLVYVCYVTSGFAFVFLAPFAVERSLSTFIFFYAVEHDGYPKHQFSLSYMEHFFQKRVDDGINGGFLTNKGDKYIPTTRTQVYYRILYPLGVATNLLKGYKEFEKEVENAQ